MVSWTVLWHGVACCVLRVGLGYRSQHATQCHLISERMNCGCLFPLLIDTDKKEHGEVYEDLSI